MAAEDSAASLAEAEAEGTLREPTSPSLHGEAESKELTVVELVRLTRQQGHIVEDGIGLAPYSPTARDPLEAQDAGADNFTAPPPPSDALPAKPKRRKARRVGTSASLPALGAAGDDPQPRKLLGNSASAPVMAKLPPIAPEPRGFVGVSPTAHLPLPQRSPRSEARRTSLLQEELRNLPIAEALRHILIERTGSLKQAYKAMDVNRSGAVNSAEFEQGLRRAQIFGSPLVGYRNASDLFKGIDKHNTGTLSLQDFLGYVPMKPARVRDTRAQWISYNNKTSAQKSQLARKPRWKAAAQPPDHNSEHVKHVRQRRELRHQLLDARKRGCLTMEEKRQLVRGLVSDEERDREWQHERGKMSEQHERIGSAIHSCSRARSELVALQQAMAKLAPEAHRNAKFAHLKLPNLNLKMRAATELASQWRQMATEA